MKTSPLCSLLFCATLLFGQAFAGEAEDALLKAAAEGDAPRIVLALSEADPNIRDKEGSTPLMLAAKAGDFESVHRLLRGGGKANEKDNKGKIAKEYLNQLLEDYLAASQGDEKMASILRSRYENPLVRQIGFGTLLGANLEHNDLVCAKYSDGKALIHGSGHGDQTISAEVLYPSDWIGENC